MKFKFNVSSGAVITRNLLKAVVLAGGVLLFGSVVAVQAQTDTAKKSPKLSIPVRRLLNTVKTAMDKADWKGAIEAVRTADVRSGGKNGNAPCSQPLVCLALGNSHLMCKDLPHAESAYLAAIALDPGFLDARINLAKVYTDAGRHAEAARAFIAAYDLSDPRHPDYLYYAAVMTLMDGNADKAAEIFERLFAAHPSNVTRQWKENYANALMTAERWQKAVPVVQDLIGAGTGEDQVKWQETLLRIYLTLDDKPKAQEFAMALSRQAPSMARWWKALVHIRLSRGHYEAALEDLIIYAFLTPLSPKEKQLMADLSLQLQVPDRAARAYEDLLNDCCDTSPKDVRQVVERLVNAYRMQGKTDKALALIDHFDPKSCNPELLLLKGDVLYADKRYKDADKAFRLAAQNNCAQKGQAWLMAGYAAWQYNDLVASRSAFQHAARFKRHRKDALAAIEQLERTCRM